MKANIPLTQAQLTELVIEGYKARGYICTNLFFSASSPDRPGDSVTYQATAELEIEPVASTKKRGRPPGSRKALETLPPTMTDDTTPVTPEPVGPQLPLESLNYTPEITI